ESTASSGCAAARAATMYSCEERSPSALTSAGSAPAPCIEMRRATRSSPASVAMAAASRWSAAVAVTSGDASCASDGTGEGGRDETGAVDDSRRPSVAPWVAATADLVVLVAFVVIGRRSHHEDAGVAGFFRVWWPFAVGLCVGWLVARLARSP